jgi:lipopolysaccharide assembly protein A
MKILFRLVAVMLFILFFGFALKNTQEVALRFFFNYEVHGPLVLLLLAFFAGGAVLGVLAMMPTVFRHRRDLAKQRKVIAAMEQENANRQLVQTQPPQPDTVL